MLRLFTILPKRAFRHWICECHLEKQVGWRPLAAVMIRQSTRTATDPAADASGGLPPRRTASARCTTLGGSSKSAAHPEPTPAAPTDKGKAAVRAYLKDKQIPSPAEQRKLLATAHSTGHFGERAMADDNLARVYWWPTYLSNDSYQ